LENTHVVKLSNTYVFDYDISDLDISKLWGLILQVRITIPEVHSDL